MFDTIIEFLVYGLDKAFEWFITVYNAYGLAFGSVVLCMVVVSVLINSVVSPMLRSGSSDVVRGKKNRG